jgi:hypothetical protein
MAEVARRSPTPQQTPPSTTSRILVRVIAAGLAIYLWFLLWRIVLLFVATLNYPSIERVWLGDTLPEDVVAEHERAARQAR